MPATTAPGKKTSQQLRLELFKEILKFTPEEVADLALEAENIYNNLCEGGHPPSEFFSKLVDFLSRESVVLNHPERDDAYECSECHRH